MGEESKEMTSFICKYAAACRAEGRRGGLRWKQGISEDEALDKGLRVKAEEFQRAGAEIYSKA